MVKKKPKKIPRQIGESNAVRDRQRIAMLLGKRVSKRTGNPYDEKRKNRSDTPAERAWYNSPTRRACNKKSKRAKSKRAKSKKSKKN